MYLKRVGAALAVATAFGVAAAPATAQMAPVNFGQCHKGLNQGAFEELAASNSELNAIFGPEKSQGESGIPLACIVGR